MTQIYAKAEKAVVFLGEEGEAECDQEESGKEEVRAQDDSRNIDGIHDSRTSMALVVDFLDAIFWKMRQSIADQINCMKENMVFPIPNQTELLQRCMMLIGSDNEELFRGVPREKKLQSIAELLARPWFQRAWVIQEFTIARKIDMFVGRRKCEWGSFLVAFSSAF